LWKKKKTHVRKRTSGWFFIFACTDAATNLIEETHPTLSHAGKKHTPMLLHSEEGQTRGPASRGSSAGGPGAFAADQGWSSTSPSSPSSMQQWQVDGLCVNVRKGMLLVASVVSAAAPHVVLGTGEGAHLDGAPLEAHGHVVHQAQVQQGDVLCVMR
jgi:hypothetical protein